MKEGARTDFGPLSRLPEGAPRLGFGAWAVGGAGWGAAGSEADREAVIRHAADLGITFFDTAPTYGGGESERLLGRALGDRRDRVQIATKVGPRDDPRASLEASLGRLGSEYVDLIQLHEALDGWEARLETLHRLREEGKARAIGICNATHLQLRRALAIAPVTTFQAAYNVVDRDVEERELPLCRERGLAFLAYRPLASGLLTGKFETPPAFADDDHRRRIYWFKGKEFERRRRVLEALGPVAAREGMHLATLALSWLLTRPGVSVVLAGARTRDQLDQNLAARALLPEVVELVDAAVRAAYPPARATDRLAAEAGTWGVRERFIAERLDGRTRYEEIAAAWTDRGEQPMMAAQVKVFVDRLAERGLVVTDG